MTKEPDPIQKFKKLYEQIKNSDLQEPAAVILATATPQGKPSARVVLLKKYDNSGFTFFTNLGSRKSHELQNNPFAALCFYWEALLYQVRVEGAVKNVSSEEPHDYFASRPRNSRIGAWASMQSQQLANRDELETRVREYQKKFEGNPVPRPDFWSGFKLTPELIEFWKRGESRLHDRLVYKRSSNGWDANYLYP
jgi:pyridoxamine 5'-phosphate oxidase